VRCCGTYVRARKEQILSKPSSYGLPFSLLSFYVISALSHVCPNLCQYIFIVYLIVASSIALVSISLRRLHTVISS
ncbi:hypothetical protein EI94DRAFT_1754264, partial [Lactarius quietus]